MLCSTAYVVLSLSAGVSFEPGLQRDDHLAFLPLRLMLVLHAPYKCLLPPPLSSASAALQNGGCCVANPVALLASCVQTFQIGDRACLLLQKVELKASNILWLGKCDNGKGKYPLSKKGQGMESLRERLHLRPRTNLIGAVARIRNALAHATHTFFQSRGFVYVHTPLITTSDCEGAGEMFQVPCMFPCHHTCTLPVQMCTLYSSFCKTWTSFQLPQTLSTPNCENLHMWLVQQLCLVPNLQHFWCCPLRQLRHSTSLPPQQSDGKVCVTYDLHGVGHELFQGCMSTGT